MPELPEVESIRIQLEPLIVGNTIKNGIFFPSPKFEQAVFAKNCLISSADRLGKYLIIRLLRNTKELDLIIHLGMTGSLSVTKKFTSDPHVRAEWTLDNGQVLRFRDVRRFGRIAVVTKGDYKTLPTLNHIGPEPFDSELTAKVFYNSLSASRSPIKTKLLSQKIIAGLGNIYVDESLWRAKINPAVRRIGIERAEILLMHIRNVLREAIDNGGTTFRDYRTPDGLTGRNQFRLDCYGRYGSPCKFCSSILSKRIIGQRSTTWCPSCQRL